MTSQANKPPLPFQTHNASNNLRSLLVKNPNPQPFRFFDHQTPQKIIKNNCDSPNILMDSKSPNDNSTLDVQSSGKKDSDCERSDPVSEAHRNIWDGPPNIDYERSNDSNSNSKDENQNMSCFLRTTFDNDLAYPSHVSLSQQLDEAKNGHDIIKQEDPFYGNGHQNEASNFQENNHQPGMEGLEGLEDPTQMISLLMQLGISEAELAQLGIIQTEDGDKTPGEPNPELLMSILQKYGLLQDEGAGLQEEVNVKNEEEVYEEQETHEEIELLVENNGTNSAEQNNLDLNNMMNLLGNPDQLNSLVNLFSNGDFSEILNSLNQVNNNQDVIEINEEGNEINNGGSYRNYPPRNFNNNNNNGNRFNNNGNRNFNYSSHNQYQYRDNTNQYNKGGNMNRGNGYNNNNNNGYNNNHSNPGGRGFHYSALNSQAQQQRPQNNNNFKRKIMTGNNTSLTNPPNSYPHNTNLNNNRGNLNSKYQNERRLNQQIFLRTPPSTTKSHLKAEKLLGIPLNELSSHRCDYDDDTIVVTMNNKEEEEDMLEPLVLQLHKEPTLRARRRGSGGDSDIEEGEILIKKKRKLTSNYTDKIYSNIHSVLQTCEDNLKNARKLFLELIPDFDFNHPEKYLDAENDM